MDDSQKTIKDDGTPKLTLNLPPSGHPADATAFHADSVNGASNANAQSTTFHEYICAPNTVPGPTSDTACGSQPLPGMSLTTVSTDTKIAQQELPSLTDAPTRIGEGLNPPGNSIFQFASFKVVTDATQAPPPITPNFQQTIAQIPQPAVATIPGQVAPVGQIQPAAKILQPVQIAPVDNFAPKPTPNVTSEVFANNSAPATAVATDIPPTKNPTFSFAFPTPT